MMDIKTYLYNTLTKSVDEFVPNEEGKVAMYTCGPTVYHFAHIGNLRSYIMEDVLEKYLRYVGYDVKRVMNITDVGHLTSDGDTGEDKMLKGAKREHKTVMDIARFYTDAFMADCEKLSIKRPDVVEPATNCIPEFIHMIEVLLEKGYAYIAGENVYFDTSKLDNYYVLSSQNEEDLQVGVREDVEEDTNKRNKTDFVLWFTKSKFDNQELKWDSPWGVGYPGWHIECSCISMKHLGEYMDIHCGGVDNIFPHHTNEIAQSEAYIGHKWCNYWFHVNHLNTKNGNYRKPLEFSWDALDNVVSAYDKLVKRIANLSTDGEVDTAACEEWKMKFAEALSHDINTSSAITVLYDMLKAELSDASKRVLVQSMDEVLSLQLEKAWEEKEADVDDELASYVEKKIEERKEAKKAKDFAKADAIREELLAKGIVLKDTREGTFWEKQ